MNFEKIIQQSLVNIVKELYHQDIDPTCLQVNKTRKDQEGDFTVVVFPLSKIVKASPEAIAGQLGDMLVKKLEILEKYNVVKGFLNLFLTNEVWLQYFKTIQSTDFRFFTQDTTQPVVVEFSSPNTNKPLHLGHVRNNLLGCSVCNILEANGHKVVRVNLVNDRGIHICKSHATKDEFYHLLNQLSTSCFEKISVHDYFEAVDEFPITGIHLNSRHPVKKNYFKGLVSCSCHSLEEVCLCKNYMDYLFLSPVFDSISKQGYHAAFSMETLEQARGIIDEKVFALGGVTLDKIAVIEHLHFGGYAVLGKRSLQMLKEI